MTEPIEVAVYNKDEDGQKPDTPVPGHILTVQEGIPVKYPNCDGTGIRVVHPSNPNAPSQHMRVAVLVLPPHASLGTSFHRTEESYYVLRGEGTVILAGETHPIRRGMFVHMPPWCEHGVKNTGTETLEILICTAPANP